MSIRGNESESFLDRVAKLGKTGDEKTTRLSRDAWTKDAKNHHFGIDQDSSSGILPAAESFLVVRADATEDTKRAVEQFNTLSNTTAKKNGLTPDEQSKLKDLGTEFVHGKWVTFADSLNALTKESKLSEESRDKILTSLVEVLKSKGVDLTFDQTNCSVVFNNFDGNKNKFVLKIKEVDSDITNEAGQSLNIDDVKFKAIYNERVDGRDGLKVQIVQALNKSSGRKLTDSPAPSVTKHGLSDSADKSSDGAHGAQVSGSSEQAALRGILEEKLKRIFPGQGNQEKINKCLAAFGDHCNIEANASKRITEAYNKNPNNDLTGAGLQRTLEVLGLVSSGLSGKMRSQLPPGEKIEEYIELKTVIDAQIKEQNKLIIQHRLEQAKLQSGVRGNQPPNNKSAEELLGIKPDVIRSVMRNGYEQSISNELFKLTSQGKQQTSRYIGLDIFRANDPETQTMRGFFIHVIENKNWTKAEHKEKRDELAETLTSYMTLKRQRTAQNNVDLQKKKDAEIQIMTSKLQDYLKK